MGCCRSSSSSSRYVSSKLWIVLQLWQRSSYQHAPQLGAWVSARECAEVCTRRLHLYEYKHQNG
jgi:hypothetical protein